MSELLKKAFAEASNLPEPEQRQFAAWVLDELTSERRWDAAFTKSEDTLSRLAEEALAEHHERQTQELDPERL